MTMLHEKGGTAPAVTAVDVVSRTAAGGWLETDYRSGVELAATHPEIDPESIAAAFSEGVETDICPITMVAEIQRAARRGWIDRPYESPAVRGINRLVAWIFSAGYITAEYTPYFGVRHGTDYERLDRAFDRLRCRYEPVGSDGERRRCVRPREAATALGRVLATLGAPVGPPTERTTLPTYLTECPTSLREAFACTYLNNRVRYTGSKRPACERRSPAFRRELAAFLTRIDDDPTTASDGEIAPPPDLADRSG